MLLVTGVVLFGCGGEEPMPTQEPPQAQGRSGALPGEVRQPGREPGEMPAADIVETATSAGFNTLVAAVDAAGLVDTLKGPGPFTVFAPTDEAFDKLPPGTLDDLLKPENKDKLTSVLTYHVVPGEYMAADITGMTSAPTLNGKELSIKVEAGTVMVDGAEVVQTDVAASNGVIHVIDSVMMP